MKTFIVECWNAVMDNQLNPLSKIPDLSCATYDYANSCLDVVYHIFFLCQPWLVFGISAVAHLILISRYLYHCCNFQNKQT